MGSLLSMGIKSITNALLYALKAFFSLLTWFLKAFLKGLKLFFVVLPITSIVFALLFMISIYVLATGLDPLPETIPLSKDPVSGVLPLFESLKKWWMQSVFVYKGQASYILLLILTVLMFIPVMTVFLCFSVFSAFGNILFFSVVADAILYLLGAIIGKSFLRQALARYYKLFPDAGRKHEEREYDRLLKKRNRMLEAEMQGDRRSKADEFYGDEDYDDEEYDEEYDEYDDEEYEEYDDEQYDEYDDEEYEEDDEEYFEDYEDDYDQPQRRRYRDEWETVKDKSPKAPSPQTPASTFDFFAGCNSRESVDKKYRSLVKLYHPDNMDGDNAALTEINIQYEKAKNRWS